jgi:hypothetical protein
LAKHAWCLSLAGFLLCGKKTMCSEKCIRNYVKKRAPKCSTNPDCETYARVRHGGPKGCKNKKTKNYWRRIKKAGCKKYS